LQTIADTQHAVEVYHLILAAVHRAKNDNSQQTFSVLERGESHSVAIIVESGSDPVATYSAYIEALLGCAQPVVGPCLERDPDRDLWYKTLELHLTGSTRQI
jgi:hypothetical protein